MNARVNIIIPEALLQQSEELVDKGYFSNFSELVRAGLRDEIIKHKETAPVMTEKDRQMFALLKEMDEKGRIVGEKEAKRHGIKV